MLTSLPAARLHRARFHSRHARAACPAAARQAAAATLGLCLLALAAVPAAADYRETEVIDGGKIAGRVTFHGQLPPDAIKVFPIPGNSPGCGAGFRKVNTIDVNNGALRQAFVMIEGITEGKSWPQRSTPVVLNQKSCRFVPAVQVVRAGTPIVVRNSDSGTLHTVTVRESIELSSGRAVERMLFNLAQPLPGDIQKRIAPSKSPFLDVGCELHNFMVAHILAPQHPYAAVVDADGGYVIDKVPPGPHSVLVWHPRLGKKRITVNVPPNGTAKADFDFRR